MRLLLGIVSLGLLVGSAVSLGACAPEPSEVRPTGPGAGGNAGTAGGAGVGGTSGAAGSAGSAGATGNMGGGGACAPRAGLDPTTLKECPTCVGKPAHCLAKSVVMSVAPDQIAQLAPCN